MLRQISVLLGLSAGLLAGSAAFAAEAGKLVFVTGQVTVAGAAAKQDRAVQEGDELVTGADGYVYVKTVDNGFLILRPNSKARITAYHIDPANPANTRVKFELLGGVARSISGQGVKAARQNFRFNTPVAAIGVRGTDFIVYTDQQTSRVAVVSGGIVVSNFSGACGPEGGGPCEGNASRELFAGQSGMLLQVRRGEHAPQLLRGGPALSPDQAAPPRQDEPAGKPTAVVNPPTVLPGADPVPNLEVQKAAALNGGKPVSQNNDTGSIKPPVDVVVNPLPEPTPTPTPDPVVPPVVQEPQAPVVVVPPAPVEPPPPLFQGVPEVMWGRYKAIAGLSADKEFTTKLSGGEYGAAASIGTAYQIARLKNTAFVMPRDGSASFTLYASEASLQVTGQQPVQAAVKDAQLNINFETRRFDTGMTVYNESNSLTFTGKGDILTNGTMVSDQLSTTKIQGYLAGAKAGEAAYLFKAVGNPKLTAEGATSWRR